MKGTLLVAGPLALDDLPQQEGLIGGAGGYAAIAATMLTPTQLWARGGEGFDPRLRAFLTQQRVDCAGVGWNGPTPRWSAAGGFIAGGPLLPDVEPTSEENLGAVLLIDLPANEGRRALAAVKKLPRSDTRPLIIAPRPESDPAWLSECTAAADVVILPARTAGGDPLALAQRLRAHGAKAVVLTAGVFGGVIVYQAKSTTWPTLPIEVVDHTGMGSTFAGTLAAWCARNWAADFSTLKRGLAYASAAASICGQGIGPKKILGAGEKELEERFNRLRRTHKF